ncbi:MAG: AMP-binding protein [Verrucomicrobiota bacterium JB025]|nr:AMP-binding protein [Verrucomicrobiota bacterium JB025]
MQDAPDLADPAQLTPDDLRSDRIGQGDPGTISGRFEAMVRRFPEALAVRQADVEVCYAELNRRANRVAHAVLGRLGAGSEPVALVAGHGLHSVVSILGILKAGKIVAVMHPANPAERIRRTLVSLDARLVVTDEGRRGLAEDAAAAGGAEVMVLESVSVGGRDDDPGVVVSPQAPAWILHTSGTTGEPKDVVQCHRNMLHCVDWHARTFGVVPGDRLSCLLPCSVIGGMRELLLPLVHGASLHPWDLKADGLGGLAGWLARERIGICRFISSVFRSFAGMLDGSEEFPDLRIIYVGGETLTVPDGKLFQRFFGDGCRMVNVIGATETGIFRHYVIDGQTELSGARMPVGYAVDDMEVVLVDGGGQPVAAGEVGEITVASRYLAQGYWGQPGLTAKVFHPLPGEGDKQVYHTGDLGCFEEDGCLLCLGRKDSQVSVNGYRVELCEVEAALMAVESVRECVVVTVEQASGHVALAGYLVGGGDGVGPLAELRKQLRTVLPDYMVPASLTVLEELPRLENGKINRRGLPEPDEEAVAAADYVEPRNLTERRVAAIWEAVLGRERIGAHDDVFALGADSLHAIQIIARVEKEFGCALRPASLFGAPTVEAFAELLIREKKPGGFDSLIVVRESDAGVPFFWVHGDHSFATLPRELGPDRAVYGLEHQSQDGMPARFRTVETIAAHYLGQIRRVWPRGPYLLGGFSFGGTVAYQIALELSRGGGEVPFLMLLDSHFPGPQMGGGALDEGLWWPRKLVRSYRRKRRLEREHPELVENRRRCREAERNGGRIAPELRSFYILDIYADALRRYQPGRFTGDMMYVKSSERPDPHHQGWRGLVDGRFDLHECPGDHDAMRRESNVRRWGPILKRHLDEIGG